MSAAIHIELDLLCLIILSMIVYQSLRNISQQMSRVLFRHVVYGIMLILSLDILWLLIDGKDFWGAIPLNKLVNALFLACAVLLGGFWYLYVLETMGYALSYPVIIGVMTPVLVYALLNLLSIWTGWFFVITKENHYERGPLFFVQFAGSMGMLMIPLFHMAIALASGKCRGSLARRVMGFYILPVLGMLFTVPYTGMPGIWPCAAVSVVLFYLNEQDREIVRDSLTGLNNRKTLEATFADYVRSEEDGKLYAFMMDLDFFKQINDTLGHNTGDEALKTTAKLLRSCLGGLRGLLVRFGGDEFLFMGFFENDGEAMDFKGKLKKTFADYNESHDLPYTLALSVGWTAYEPGQSLSDFTGEADAQLYREKEKNHRLRKDTPPAKGQKRRGQGQKERAGKRDGKKMSAGSR